MITLKATNGSELKVEGSLQEFIDAFRNKSEAKIKKQRVNKKASLWIEGRKVGEIIETN